MNEIRDRREKHWFWIDDAVIDAHATALGPFGLALYMVLARHADRQGQCYPSLRRLQALLGDASRNTIKKYLALLVSRRLITWTPRLDEDGNASSHLYTLLPITTSPDAPHGGGSTIDPEGIGFKELGFEGEETPFPSFEGEQEKVDPHNRGTIIESVGEHTVCSRDDSSMAHMTQTQPLTPSPDQMSRQEIRALMASIWREEGEEFAHVRAAPPPTHGPAP